MMLGAERAVLAPSTEVPKNKKRMGFGPSVQGIFLKNAYLIKLATRA